MCASAAGLSCWSARGGVVRYYDLLIHCLLEFIVYFYFVLPDARGGVVRYAILVYSLLQYNVLFLFFNRNFHFFWLQGAGRPDVELSAAQAT
jgi:hypothetical protein